MSATVDINSNFFCLENEVVKGIEKVVYGYAFWINQISPNKGVYGYAFGRLQSDSAWQNRIDAETTNCNFYHQNHSYGSKKLVPVPY